MAKRFSSNSYLTYHMFKHTHKQIHTHAVLSLLCAYLTCAKSFSWEKINKPLDICHLTRTDPNMTAPTMHTHTLYSPPLMLVVILLSTSAFRCTTWSSWGRPGIMYLKSIWQVWGDCSTFQLQTLLSNPVGTWPFQSHVLRWNVEVGWWSFVGFRRPRFIDVNDL